MHSLAFPAATGVAARGDFVGVQHLLDIGGGSGSYCIALALRYPEKRFTVMDLPEVAPTTRQYIAAYSVQEQVGVLPFDMFATPWPDSYDAHFISNIFHDFDTAMCHQLASSSFAALPPGGRIYVHEVLLSDAKDGPLTPASFALAMTYFNGRGGQYTSEELAAILGRAGFEDVKTTTYGYYSLTSGRKGD
jgi:cyclopropane fatty-acyl-phospholipid synthase-like methyltransferase